MLSASEPAWAQTVSIDTDPETQAGLEAELRAELPELNFAQPGDLQVLISTASTAWQLEIRQGAEVLTQRTLRASDPESARRIATLLVVEAVSNYEPPFKVVSGQPANPAKVGVPPAEYRLGLGAAVGYWLTPAAPRLGWTLAADRRFGPWSLGLGGRYSSPCCGVSSEGLSAALHSLVISARGSRRITQLDFGRLLARVSAGLLWQSATLQVQQPVFAGPREQISRWGFEGRVGLELAGPHADGRGLSWWAGTGIQVQLPQMSVAWPDPRFGADPPLESGILTPWLEAGIEFNL